jgi:ABC-type multidrug transport system permease subunit
MKDLFKTILISVGTYCLLTLPHFIYMYTWGNHGIQYSFEVLIAIATLSSILSVPISKSKFFK